MNIKLFVIKMGLRRRLKKHSVEDWRYPVEIGKGKFTPEQSRELSKLLKQMHQAKRQWETWSYTDVSNLSQQSQAHRKKAEQRLGAAQRKIDRFVIAALEENERNPPVPEKPKEKPTGPFQRPSGFGGGGYGRRKSVKGFTRQQLIDRLNIKRNSSVDFVYQMTGEIRDIPLSTKIAAWGIKWARDSGRINGTAEMKLRSMSALQHATLITKIDQLGIPENDIHKYLNKKFGGL